MRTCRICLATAWILGLVGGCVVLPDKSDLLDPDRDGSLYPEDCDNTDASAHPGAVEVPYDGVDNDCDAATPDDDLDADNFPLAEDCDDSARDIHPGATEIPYDGVDNDCNDETLDDDLDDDGRDLQEDCDDLDASVHPGATERPYDGVDNDCDAATPDDDLDADGYAAALDCDDEDGSVYPGASDVVGDGIDSDCDGSEMCPQDGDGDGYRPDAFSTVFSDDVDCDDPGEATLDDPIGDCDDSHAAVYPSAVSAVPSSYDLSALGVMFYSNHNAEEAGDAVTSLGDINGDGLTDFAIGAQAFDNGSATDAGVVFVYLGSRGNRLQSGTLEDTRSAIFVGPGGNGQRAGISLAALGDVNADGFDDWVIASNSDQVGWLVYGAIRVSGTYELPLAGTMGFSGVLLGGVDQRVDNVSWTGDLNEDGTPGWVVSDASVGSEEGMAYVFFEPPSGNEAALTTADATFIGENPGDRLGEGQGSGGLARGGDTHGDGFDFDGDGIADLMLGAHNHDARGAAYVAVGPLSARPYDVADADYKYTGEDVGDHAGQFVADGGDLTGDGGAELVVSAPDHGEGATSDSGAIYLVSGGTPVTQSLASAPVRIYSSAAGERLQEAVGLGDYNGDCQDDLAVGDAARYEDADSDAGGVWIFFGPLAAGVYDVSADADSHIAAVDRRSTFGSLGAPGDVNADGFSDLLIGDTGWGAQLSDRNGAAWLLYGGP